MIDSLFILRHAQRADKISSTVSSIEFSYPPLTIQDTFNPPLATFQSTQNKSNNGYTQSKETAYKLAHYINKHEANELTLSFHTSPYLRCLETIKYIVDTLQKQDLNKTISIVISIDHVLSEWLNNELDISYFPPNDNGDYLLSTAVQYLTSNINMTNNKFKIKLNLHDSYTNGPPGPFNESFLQQYNRINQGLISIVKREEKEQEQLQTEDVKNIVLVMTHGACVRSILSKLIGKSIFMEVPLSSISLIKPIRKTDKEYLWKVVSTDLEIPSQEFFETDLFHNSNPYENFKFTFKQLNFTNPVNPTPNRQRHQSDLLKAYSSHGMNGSDDDSSSDDEGLSFNVGRRFRSSSLFGPVLNNPFHQDASKKSVNKGKLHQNISPFENSMGPSFLKKSNSYMKSENTDSNPSREYSFQNIDAHDGVHDRFSANATNDYNYRFQNIDINDGVHPPDLADSSNNSSNNSLITLSESVKDDDKNITSTNLNNHNNTIDDDNLDNTTNDQHNNDNSSNTNNNSNNNNNNNNNNNDNNGLQQLNDLLSNKSESITPPSWNTDLDIKPLSKTNSFSTIKPEKSSIFDKSLIEETMKTTDPNLLTNTGSTKNTSTNSDDTWLPFKPKSTENKFKIDLYGKKNRIKLNLYSDSNEDEGEWFGFNR